MSTRYVPCSPNPWVTRYEGNPILTGADFPPEYQIQHCFNSGVVKRGGRYLMLCRLEDRGLHPSFWVAESDDGIRFTPRSGPVKMPVDDPLFAEYTDATFYDPRITEIDGTYYIVHAAHSHHHGCRLSLLESSDMEHFEWRGFISEIDNRNGVLFPQKFGDDYVRIDRPNTSAGVTDIWISYSKDLIHWGRNRCCIRQKSCVSWAYTKIGGGAVPIKTPEGWLNIIHGVRSMCASHYLYSLGVVLHDLEDPSKILSVGSKPILAPEMDYELIGQTPSVVFTAGAVVEDDGEVKIYYGGADTVMCLATSSIDKLLAAAKS